MLPQPTRTEAFEGRKHDLCPEDIVDYALLYRMDDESLLEGGVW